MRDHPTLARGLETEYGANVELVLHGDPHRREKFTASGHGYLNQNEYVLHFALPPGPDPKAPLAGLVFDLVVVRGRIYRCAAHVASLRQTTLAAPWRGEGLVLKGGLDFEDADPTSGVALTRARPDPLGFALSLRYVVREGR